MHDLSNDSGIFSGKHVSEALEMAWMTLKEVFKRQLLNQSVLLPEAACVLPAELLLLCFSFMGLEALILSRCVCSEWRQLVLVSDIHPTRRRYLELYDRMLANELFLESRTWILDNLKPFDRELYIAALVEQCTGSDAEIPEDFQMYILEWPARMAIAYMWPGLPFVDSKTSDIQCPLGINYLARPPQLSALVFKHRLPEVCFIPGLLVSRDPFNTTWILFDKAPHERLGFVLHGRVFEIALHPNPPFGDEVNDASIIPYDYDEVSGSDLYDNMFEDAEPGWEDMVTFGAYTSWIRYLECCWSARAEPSLNYSGETCPVQRWDGTHIDTPLDDLEEEMEKEGYEYLDRSYRDVPAPPWTRRGEAIFQRRLVTGSIPPGSNVRVYLS